MTLFGFQPEKSAEILLKPLRHRIWTENKARLVERYLHYFLFITKHGTYIDGFAGQQYEDQPESWAAKRVIELRPRWLRHFFLCEIDPVKIAAIEALVQAQPPRSKALGEPMRTVEIMPGDFNQRVPEILASGHITQKEATFCLLDQHTFECKWATVQSLARHKTAGSKIELFYFLGTKWLHRAMSGLIDAKPVEEWWGNSNWSRLANAGTQSICDHMRARFLNELGYRHVHPWPIFETAEGGAIMYHMIHASDHPEAPILMRRAYEKALTAPEPKEQFLLDIGAGDYLGEARA